jgi:hypothetical protein
VSEVREQLIAKLKVLSETVWERQAGGPMIDEWLNNFREPAAGATDAQELHALYLLSRFMYFGRREMRELLHSLFRDLYRYPIVEHLRRNNGDTTDAATLDALFASELAKTRFFGVGNPSESGTHLLYYFRQENGLSGDLFWNTHKIFNRTGQTPPTLREPSISRYVFIDDFCGSGTQAIDYSVDIVDDIKALGNAEVAYYVLFATKEGLKAVRDNARFDRVDAIFELDDTYKCFGPESRYFRSPPDTVTSTFAETMCKHYGRQLVPAHPMGYKDAQLLIGFYHNTPDNSLPVLWYSHPNSVWAPIFRRYPKLFDWGSP